MIDKSVVKQVATECGIKESKTRHFVRDGKKFPVSECSDKGLQDFAQAIYALGVKDERERIAKIFDEAGWHPYAKLIRES